MVDFISEVEEELRKDDYNKFLRKFGPWIVAALVAIVAFVGYLEWRDYDRERTARAASASYLAADELLSNGDLDGASRAFLQLADVAPDGYAGLSLMRAAVIAFDRGNPAEAVRLYDAAADRFNARRHADLARLKAAYAIAGQDQWADVERRAERLMEQGAPYEYLARELVATAALNQGDENRAREQFAYLNTIPGVPPSISQRADQALTLINSRSDAELPAPDPVLPEAELDQGETTLDETTPDDMTQDDANE